MAWYYLDDFDIAVEQDGDPTLTFTSLTLAQYNFKVANPTASKSETLAESLDALTEAELRTLRQAELVSSILEDEDTPIVALAAPPITLKTNRQEVDRINGIYLEHLAKIELGTYDELVANVDLWHEGSPDASTTTALTWSQFVEVVDSVNTAYNDRVDYRRIQEETLINANLATLQGISY